MPQMRIHFPSFLKNIDVNKCTETDFDEQALRHINDLWVDDRDKDLQHMLEAFAKSAAECTEECLDDHLVAHAHYVHSKAVSHTAPHICHSLPQVFDYV